MTVSIHNTISCEMLSTVMNDRHDLLNTIDEITNNGTGIAYQRLMFNKTSCTYTDPEGMINNLKLYVHFSYINAAYKRHALSIEEYGEEKRCIRAILKNNPLPSIYKGFYLLKSFINAGWAHPLSKTAWLYCSLHLYGECTNFRRIGPYSFSFDTEGCAPVKIAKILSSRHNFVFVTMSTKDDSGMILAYHFFMGILLHITSSTPTSFEKLLHHVQSIKSTISNKTNS